MDTPGYLKLVPNEKEEARAKTLLGFAKELSQVTAQKSAVIAGVASEDDMVDNFNPKESSVDDLVDSCNDLILKIFTVDYKKFVPFFSPSSRAPLDGHVFLETETDEEINNIINDVVSRLQQFLNEYSKNESEVFVPDRVVFDVKGILGAFSRDLISALYEGCEEDSVPINSAIWNFFRAYHFNEFKNKDMDLYVNKIFNFIKSKYRDIVPGEVLSDTENPLYKILLENIEYSFKLRGDSDVLSAYFTKLVFWLNANHKFLTEKYNGDQSKIKDAVV